MTVNKNDINQMADLIAMMNGQTPPVRNVPKNIAPASIHASPDVAAMKTLLMKLQDDPTPVNKMAAMLVTESVTDKPLRAAMMTEETTDGVRIGDFEIFAKKDGARKLFDVLPVGGEVFAADLTLYEAAYGIARALSDGELITGTLIRSILRLEGDYAAALNEAIHYRHSLKNPKKLLETRREVLEDRYSLAKQRAARARDSLAKVIGPLPF